MRCLTWRRPVRLDSMSCIVCTVCPDLSRDLVSIHVRSRRGRVALRRLMEGIATLELEPVKQDDVDYTSTYSTWNVNRTAPMVRGICSRDYHPQVQMTRLLNSGALDATYCHG